ncbi:MAG: DUF3696 domain-containing protein [Pseudonocardiaceae bacterium]
MVMSLVRMALTNYRCFAKRLDIELRPVTVVLGRNNSGKSALVRAPMVFSTGFRTDSPAPLDLDLIGEEILDSFTDLIYGGRPHGSIQIDLEFNESEVVSPIPRNGPPILLNATIQHVDEYRLQIVSSLSMQVGNREARFEWEQDDPRSDERLYTITADGERYMHVPVRFAGLLPVETVFWKATHARPDWSVIKTLSGTIRRSLGPVRYLGPFRNRPARRYRLPARMPAEVGVTGEFSAQMLGSDFARQKGHLIRQVNKSFTKNLPGWRIDVVERGGMYTVVLKSDDDKLQVNLADTGTGVAQVLPIFVQRAFDIINPPAEGTLEIVEEPELHLHPAAHASLADLYLEAARQTGVRFLIETHSETFLLRLRRRIAEGVIDPETVAVYFVENHDGASGARRIRLDEDGNVDYWPQGVFSEDYAETRALATAQLDRKARDAR